MLARSSLLPLRRSERDDVDAAVGADNGEPAVGEGDIRRCRLQSFCRREFALVDHSVGRDLNGLALGIEAARSACTTADRDRVRVALTHTDLLPVDAETLRRELYICCLVSLTGRLRADIHIDKAILGEADFRALGGIAHGDFQIICQANATPFAAPRCLRTSGSEAGVIHSHECRIEHGREVAGIVGLADGRGMRHCRLRHHVAPAQFRPVDAEFARRCIDQAFQQVIAFRATGAAVGIDRHRMGEHAGTLA